MSPNEIKSRLSSGLLSFPVTHFNADMGLNLDSYGGHVEWLSGFGAAALFAAGGTGEFFSLTPAEIADVTRAAKAASGGVPIITGCGYGTTLARDIAGKAEEAGADGLLSLSTQVTGQSGGVHYGLDLSTFSTDGLRPQSAADRTNESAT